MLFRRNAGRRVVFAKGAERGEDLFFHSASLSFCRPFMIKNVCNAIEDDVTILSATVYGIRTQRIFPGETRFSIAISINDASTRFPRRKNRRKAKRRKDRFYTPSFENAPFSCYSRSHDTRALPRKSHSTPRFFPSAPRQKVATTLPDSRVSLAAVSRGRARLNEIHPRPSPLHFSPPSLNPFRSTVKNNVA